jgi:outer membrane protein
MNFEGVNDMCFYQPKSRKSSPCYVGPAIIVALFIAVITFAVRPASAAPELRIGVVDLQKALTSSKEGMKAQKAYEAEVKKAQAGLDKKKEEFESLKKSFEKQRQSLNDQARAQKEEELITTEKEVARSFQDAKEQLRRRNQVLVTDLIKEIRTVVEEVAQASGYTLVLERNAQGVLFADNAVDITDKVVEKYNAAGSKK